MRPSGSRQCFPFVGGSSPRQCYEEQKQKTGQVAQQFHAQLEELRNEFGEPNLKESELDSEQRRRLKKLQFMTVQATTANQLLVKMEAQISTWSVKAFWAPAQMEDVASQQAAFYKEATRLLLLMEVSFNSVMFVPPNRFSEAFEAWKNILKEHPKLCLLAGVCGACVGAGVGGELIHLHGLTLLVKGVGGVALGAAGGAVVGLCVIAVLLGLWQFWKWYSSASADKRLRSDMERMMAELGDRDLDDRAIIALADLFGDCFVQPLEAVLKSDRCLICFDEFDANPLPQKRAVTSPSCTGKHFIHAECLSHWQQTPTGRDLKCVCCRQ